MIIIDPNLDVYVVYLITLAELKQVFAVGIFKHEYQPLLIVL